MPLTDEQRSFYENSLEVIKGEVSDLNQQIEDELAKVRDRIMELQNDKKAALQMYAAGCNRLGVPNDLKDEEDAAPVEAG
jgi:hypothetical protein